MNVVWIDNRAHPAGRPLVAFLIHRVDLQPLGVNVQPHIQPGPWRNRMHPDLPLVAFSEIDAWMRASEVVFVPAAPFQRDKMLVTVELLRDGPLQWHLD